MTYLIDCFRCLSIRWKIIVLSTVGVALTVGGLVFYMQYETSSLLRENLEVTLKQTSERLSQDVSLAYQLSDWKSLQQRANKLIESDDVPVAVVVFFDKNDEVKAYAPQPDAKFAQRKFASDGISQFQFQGEQVIGQVTSVAGKKTKDQGKKKGSGKIALGLSTRPVQTKLSSILWWTSGIGLLLGIFGMVVLYFIVGWTVVNPFRTKAGAIAEGNLRDSYHENIILGGELGQSFEMMRDRIGELVTELDSYACQINEVSNSLLSASEQLNRTASEQNREIEQSSSAVTELSQSIQEVSDRSETGQDIAESAQEQAEDGGHAVDEAVREMNKIQESVNRTAGEVEKLGESGEEIGKIVDVISQIAEQTSLLALNAAIEAARAGEQGKGFAVVADEVSPLADRVGESADEIEDLIDQIQNQTNSSVEAMEQGIEQVKSGVEVVDKAGEVLDSIVESSDRTFEQMSAIASSMSEQAAAADDVAESVEKVNAASDEVVQSSEELVNQGETLEDMAVKMRNWVNEFELDENDEST